MKKTLLLFAAALGFACSAGAENTAVSSLMNLKEGTGTLNEDGTVSFSIAGNAAGTGSAWGCECEYDAWSNPVDVADFDKLLAVVKNDSEIPAQVKIQCNYTEDTKSVGSNMVTIAAGAEGTISLALDGFEKVNQIYFQGQHSGETATYPIALTLKSFVFEPAVTYGEGVEYNLGEYGNIAIADIKNLDPKAKFVFKFSEEGTVNAGHENYGAMGVQGGSGDSQVTVGNFCQNTVAEGVTLYRSDLDAVIAAAEAAGQTNITWNSWGQDGATFTRESLTIYDVIPAVDPYDEGTLYDLGDYGNIKIADIENLADETKFVFAYTTEGTIPNGKDGYTGMGVQGGSWEKGDQVTVGNFTVANAEKGITLLRSDLQAAIDKAKEHEQDVITWNTWGIDGAVTFTRVSLTIYKLKAAAEDPVTTADYTVKFVCGGEEIKTPETRNGNIGEAVTITDEDKADIVVGEVTYKYAADNSAEATIAEDGTTVVTITFEKATALKPINVKGIKGQIYTLGGVKVSNANKPGLYVQDGKLIMVK